MYPEECRTQPGSGWHDVAKFDYLIRTRDDLDGWPLLIAHSDQPSVFQPAGWVCIPVEGWGEFRFRTGETEVAFSGEDPGVQVIIDGPMSRAEADRMVQVIADQLAAHTGVATVVRQLS